MGGGNKSKKEQKVLSIFFKVSRSIPLPLLKMPVALSIFPHRRSIAEKLPSDLIVLPLAV